MNNHLKRAKGRTAVCEPGNAIVEFVGIMVVIIGPALILLMSLSAVLEAQFSVQAATREAVREVVRAPEVDVLHKAQEIALDVWSDRGHSERLTVSVMCEPSGCQTPGASIEVTVSTQIVLPATGILVPVSAAYTMDSDIFRNVP
ncbi:hypothetical protein HC352_06325 [Arcanobacterium buesumense]|uniref:Pilus assembly protein TadE n=1 Tax=Arcanobacterium buesumense TaxID=2722751 RepID=A0A6H2EM67_9ACTO|nr:hypothetical protein HC352_06325 [Arcanobacterium buesumense]